MFVEPPKGSFRELKVGMVGFTNSQGIKAITLEFTMSSEDHHRKGTICLVL